MIALILILPALLIAGLFLYLYRWNLIHPLKKGTLKVDHLDRDFLYHLPHQLTGRPRLILAYHGTGIKANVMQIFTGHELDLLADKEKNTIIIYPQGYKNSWNDCCKNVPYETKKLNLDDVGFTRKIIDLFAEKYNADLSEVYAIGFSNGGQMVSKLAKLKPEWFKGFAVISANLPDADNTDCGDTLQPVSLMLINGMEDPIIPFNGGKVTLDGKDFGTVMSSEQTIAHWLSAGNFSGPPMERKFFALKKDQEVVTAVKQDFYSSSANKRISYIRVKDGGHTIPNKNFRIPIKKMGNMNKEVDAPQLIWDFFAELK